MDKFKFKKIFRLAIFGTIAALVILAILFAGFSAIILYSNIPPTFISQVTTILGAISLFLAAFITSRIANKNGMLIGSIFGAIASILIFIFTFLNTNIAFSIGELTKIIIIMIASCLGGIFGVNSND